MTNYSAIVCAGFLLMASCKVDPKTPVAASNDVVEVQPPGFPDPVYSFKQNPVSQNKFILGRALFYETLLSVDNTVSCGTCHQQRVAFANEDHTLSHGINSQLGRRNAPALFNLAWHPLLMYDGVANNLEVQPVLPICNPVEMGESIAGVVAKLQASSKYKTLFKNAFGSDTVNAQGMLKSLTQFLALIYSYNSRYDHFKRQEKGVAFSASELKGYQLFIDHCSSCHKEPLFTDFKFRSNGLSVDPFLRDSGRCDYTHSIADAFTFKTPSLRNVDRTGPYMHDGRFRSLEDCLDHYTAINSAANPDPLLQNGLPISAQDKTDIIAFLKTLTDDQFALPLDKMDTRFADPR